VTTSYPRDSLSIDQQLALRTAATHLQRQFDGTFGAETIERFLHSSYDAFAARAVVLNFLPLLAERFARQRRTALARVEGKHHDGTPVALFLCTHNAGRSQMALGFFTHLAADRAIAWSGGSDPADRINPAAIAAMAERGIDISAEALDRRSGARRRRRHYHGLRGRVPRVSRPPLPRLARRRPGRARPRRGAAHPRRHRTLRPRPAR
jgi:arsenate reductase (thioredoxin)